MLQIHSVVNPEAFISYTRMYILKSVSKHKNFFFPKRILYKCIQIKIN